jgi:membrane protein DedA with SNARE-associated domain/rhodanese-related sulfurtransferase
MDSNTTEFLINHGLPVVFGVVFLEQLGLPLPAVPVLLAAGTLSGAGGFSPLLGIGVTVLACVIADGLWFYLGRYRGHQVLGLLCRISLEPDSCVRRTQNLFTRHGLRGLLVSKFVPGLSTLAPPMAGMSGMSIGRFLVVDGLGSLLYGGCFIVIGYFFAEQIQQVAAALAGVGGGAVKMLIALAAAYVGFKYWQRRRLLGELRMARITVDELRRKQDAGEAMVILDLRSAAEVEQDGSLIRGAVHLRPEDIYERHHEIPRDREIIVYCSCPNEVTSARVAQLLQKKGFSRVRPLLGGIDAWRKQNYPVESRASAARGAIGPVPTAPLRPVVGSDAA